jgi:hypothetical protein
VNTKVCPLYVVIKALCLFVVVNVLYALVAPPIADVSIYNSIVPGLERMPFGNSGDPYTLTIDNADAMFTAHKISAKKTSGEIRVALIGDSSIWGEALLQSDTLAAQWNRLNLQCDGKTLKFYNLGYPHPSIIKDLIFIEEVKDRQPDAILWFVTLNTLMNQYRINPFLMGNRERALQLMDVYDIPFAPRKTLAEGTGSFYEETIVGQRSFLARWIKLQALSAVWSATGTDVHNAISNLESPPADVRKSPSYRDLELNADLRESLLLGAIDAGHKIAGDIPVILVNEPIFVATGMNSDIRYNDLYPRWAYDQYREIVAAQARASSLTYLDLWNIIPPKYFTDTPLHLNVNGERLLAEQLSPTLLSTLCP